LIREGRPFPVEIGAACRKLLFQHSNGLLGAVRPRVRRFGPRLRLIGPASLTFYLLLPYGHGVM
jgi:hypothetical protein